MLVIFDYFGVIAQDHFWYTAQAGIAAHGNSATMKQTSLNMNLGTVSWDDYCKAVASDIHVDIDEVKKRYLEHKVTPHIIEMINDLKSSGHTIVLLSNASAEYLVPIMHKLGLDKLFERIFVSSDMHYVKPDPRAYQYVLVEMKTSAGDAVMIDDNHNNTVSAQTLGMASVEFKSSEQCRQQLSELKLL